MSYCVKCRRQTGNVDPQLTTTINGRHLLKSQCSVCGSRKAQFISEQQAKQGGFIGFFKKLLGFGGEKNGRKPPRKPPRKRRRRK